VTDGDGQRARGERSRAFVRPTRATVGRRRCEFGELRNRTRRATIRNGRERPAGVVGVWGKGYVLWARDRIMSDNNLTIVRPTTVTSRPKIVGTKGFTRAHNTIFAKNRLGRARTA